MCDKEELIRKTLDPVYIMEKLKENRKKGLNISSITLAEMEYGIENAAKEYGILKKDLKDRNCLIGPLDMLIAAHARSLKLTLVTNNIGEFERIKDLRIEDWK